VCDVLEGCPALLGPWASGFLREFVAGVVLSEKDFRILCAHLFVLEMAQERGSSGCALFFGGCLMGYDSAAFLLCWLRKRRSEMPCTVRVSAVALRNVPGMPA